MNKKASGIMLIMFLVGSLSVAFSIQRARAEPGTIYIRADGSIDPPTANITTSDNVTYTFTGNTHDSIVVERDNIIVDGASCTVQGAGVYLSKGFYLSGIRNITIKNIEIKAFWYGVFLNSSFTNIFSGNHITNNSHAVELYYSSNNTVSGNHITNNTAVGIELYQYSNYNTFLGNHITNNNDGVYFVVSFNNTFSENNITNNKWDGITLSGGSGNTFSGNDITNNRYGAVLLDASNNTFSGNNFVNDGLSVFYSYGSMVTGNLVNGKPLVYLEDTSDIVINDAGQVIVVNCDRIKVENLNLFNASIGIELWRTQNTKISGNHITNNTCYGICLGYSPNNTVLENNISNNGFGVYQYSSSNNTLSENHITNNSQAVELYESSNNTVSGNHITNNEYDGIYLQDSSRNSIFRNNITANNYYGIYLYSSSNYNSISGNQITNNNYGVRLDYSSNNTIYHNNFINNIDQVYVLGALSNVWDNGVEGNYWSNYTGVDVNPHDGIGDTPHILDADNQDNYPLMSPYIPGDYNHDGIVNMTDVDMVRVAWQSRVGDLNYNHHVDFNMDNIINIADAAIIGVNWQKHV